MGHSSDLCAPSISTVHGSDSWLPRRIRGRGRRNFSRISVTQEVQLQGELARGTAKIAPSSSNVIRRASVGRGRMQHLAMKCASGRQLSVSHQELRWPSSLASLKFFTLPRAASQRVVSTRALCFVVRQRSKFCVKGQQWAHKLVA